MSLRTYLKQSGRGAAAGLARALGVTPVMVSQWADGSKQIAVERACDIEKITGGAVRRWDLRPADWHRIWPELIDADGAPEIVIERSA